MEFVLLATTSYAFDNRNSAQFSRLSWLPRICCQELLFSLTYTTRRFPPHVAIEQVANLDLPYDAATYMHRVGRTGRFGTHGVAIALATPPELQRLRGFLQDVAGGQVSSCSAADACCASRSCWSC